MEVKGLPCPGFSVTLETPWFLIACGRLAMVYDSSVFPGSRSHGGLPWNANPDPHVLTTVHGDLVEFPISLVNTFGKQMYFSVVVTCVFLIG
ncbi:MAG: hypothetical protein IPP33_09580 [Flavobacteriales bacterium]|nr:hypothetical protein [Flavobacteriales bacterium]